MPFYIRKAISVGPLRFNLSKSGIGISVGIPGFRVGSGARGNYIHAGRHGLYYRKTLPGEPVKSAFAFKKLAEKLQSPLAAKESTPPVTSVDAGSTVREYESRTTLRMVDASSEDILGELNSKRTYTHTWPWVLGAGVLVTVGGLAYGLAGWMVILVAIVGTVSTFWSYQRDQVARHVVSMYELDTDLESSYQELCAVFEPMCEPGAVWHVQSERALVPSNRSVGVASSVDRKAVSPMIGRGPEHFRTNVAVPKLPVGRQNLYFLPDRILVEASEGYGAVRYSDLLVTVEEERFIEFRELPSGAKVVGRTWEHVNQNGGPDRRFKYNRELPIAIYERVRLRSPSGLNELVQVTLPGLGTRFRSALLRLGQ